MRIARSFAVFALCTTVAVDSGAQAPALATKTLTELAGRAIPGLENIGLSDVQVGEGYFSGTVPALAIPGQSGAVRITGFVVGASKEFAIVISLPTFALSAYLPAIRGTPLDNFSFSGAKFIIAPTGAGGSTVSPPAAIAGSIGSSLALPAAPGLVGDVALSGQLADLMTGLGVPTSGLPIAGGLPTALFAGGIPAGQLATAFYPLLNLNLNVPAAVLGRAGPPIPGATISALQLGVTGASGSPVFSLAGSLALSGSRTVALSASEIGTARQVLRLTGTGVTAADLVGGSVPGLSSLAITGVELSSTAVSASVMLGTIPARARAVVAGTGRSLTLSADSIRMSDLVAAAKGTPLDDLVMRTPTFTYSTATGLSLSAQAAVTGASADILKGLNVPTTAVFPTAATFDPLIFAKPTQIPNFVISLPLPAGTKIGETALTSPSLKFSAQGGSVGVAVGASVTTNIAGHALSFPDASVSRSAAGAVTISAPIPLSALQSLVPIPGVTPRDARITIASGGARDSVTATGGISVNSKPLTLTMTAMSGAGRLNIDGSLTVGDISGQSIPGLSDLAVSNVEMAFTPSESHLAATFTFKGVATTAVIFKAAGQTVPNLALLMDELQASTFLPLPSGSPLNQLSWQAPALVIVPAGNNGSVAGPAPVRTQLKLKTGESLSLSAGLNVFGSAGFGDGPIATLLKNVGVPTSGLPTLGEMPSTVFSKPEIPDFNLSFPLGALSTSLPKSAFTLETGTLKIAHSGGAASFGVTAGGHASIGTEDVNFTFTFSAGRDSAGAYTAVKGETSGYTWDKPFGVDWLTVHSLGLAARVGATGSFSLSGITDLGNIKGLAVKTSVSYTASGVSAGSLELSGANIPLAEIPLLNALPGASEVTLRNLFVSNSAVAGEARLGSADSWLEAVLFKGTAPAAGWTFALLYTDFSFGTLIPGLPAAAKTELGKIKLRTAALVLSQSGVSGNIATLPTVAQEKLRTIYGPSITTTSIPSGVGLIGSFDPAASDPSIASFVRSVSPGGGNLAVSATITGIFGSDKPLGLDFAATLPAITLPPSFSYLHLPSEFIAGFHIRLDGLLMPSFGVEISADFPIPGKDLRPVTTVKGGIALALTATGGVTAGFSATTLTPWVHALGIDGFTLLPASELKLEASATSAVTLSVTGLTMVGNTAINVSGNATVIGGTLASGALGGGVSKIPLSDVIALSEAVVRAGGGTPPRTDFPGAHIENFKIGFASPGASLPLYNITAGGIRLAGDLWLLFPDSPLGSVDGNIDARGISLFAAVHDFAVGPIAMQGDTLDLYAKLDPINPPHLKVKGNSTILGVNTKMELLASGSRVTFSASQNFGPSGLSYKFGAFLDGPSGLTAKQLADADLGLDAALDLGHLSAYITKGGLQVATAALGGVNSGLSAANDSLAAARRTVTRLDGDIAAAKRRVSADKKSTSELLSDAQTAVTAAKRDVDRLAGNIKECKDAIKTCNQTKRVCVWYDIIKDRCTDHDTVPDLVARAKCAANNTTQRLNQARYESEKVLADAALVVANGTLKDVQDGLDEIPVEADPRVAPLIASRIAAQAAVDAAQALVNEGTAATSAITRGLNGLQAAGGFEFKAAHIQGSLKQLIAQQPVLLDVTYAAGGRTMTTRLPFAPTNPTYTLNGFELLALQGLYAVSLADANASPAVQNAARSAYLAKRDQLDSAVEAVTGRNAIRRANGTGETTATIPTVEGASDLVGEQERQDSVRAVAAKAAHEAAARAARQQALAQMDLDIAAVAALIRPLAGLQGNTPLPPISDIRATSPANETELNKLKRRYQALVDKRDALANRPLIDPPSDT